MVLEVEEKDPENLRFKEIDDAKNEIARTLALPRAILGEREKHNNVTRIAYNYLLANGKFYFNDQTREGYWFESESKQLWRIDSEKFKSFLSVGLDVNREDKAFRWILRGILDRVAEKAPKVTPHRLSYFDESKFVLYLNNRPGRMLRIDGLGHNEIDNGDGALFLWDDDWEEFQYVEDGNEEITLRKLIYEKHSLDDSQSNYLSVSDLTGLVDAYVQSVFFRTIVLHRPLLAYIGPFGSGKTVMQNLNRDYLIREKFRGSRARGSKAGCCYRLHYQQRLWSVRQRG